MSEHLSSFLVDLACDRSRMVAFAADPHAVLDGTRLSDDERAAILAGDSARLRKAMGDGGGGKGGIRIKKKPGAPKPVKKKRPAGKKR
jgi:hypothetical protein